MAEIPVNLYERLPTYSSDEHTVALLEMEGEDSGTVFVDTSSYEHTCINEQGTVITDTDERKFGFSSMFVLGYPGYKPFITINQINAYPNDEWRVVDPASYRKITVECWINRKEYAGFVDWSAIFSRGNNYVSSGPGYNCLMLNTPDDDIKLGIVGTRLGDVSGDSVTSDWITCPLNTWYHVAWITEQEAEPNTTATLYFDGQLVKTGTLTRMPTFFDNTPVHVGGFTYNSGSIWIDSLRFSDITRIISSEIPVNFYERVGIRAIF